MPTAPLSWAAGAGVGAGLRASNRTCCPDSRAQRAAAACPPAPPEAQSPCPHAPRGDRCPPGVPSWTQQSRPRGGVGTGGSSLCPTRGAKSAGPFTSRRPPAALRPSGWAPLRVGSGCPGAGGSVHGAGSWERGEQRTPPCPPGPTGAEGSGAACLGPGPRTGREGASARAAPTVVPRGGSRVHCLRGGSSSGGAGGRGAGGEVGVSSAPAWGSRSGSSARASGPGLCAPRCARAAERAEPPLSLGAAHTPCPPRVGRGPAGSERERGAGSGGRTWGQQHPPLLPRPKRCPGRGSAAARSPSPQQPGRGAEGRPVLTPDASHRAPLAPGPPGPWPRPQDAGGSQEPVQMPGLGGRGDSWHQATLFPSGRLPGGPSDPCLGRLSASSPGPSWPQSRRTLDSADAPSFSPSFAGASPRPPAPAQSPQPLPQHPSAPPSPPSPCSPPSPSWSLPPAHQPLPVPSAGSRL